MSISDNEIATVIRIKNKHLITDIHNAINSSFIIVTGNSDTTMATVDEHIIDRVNTSRTTNKPISITLKKNIKDRFKQLIDVKIDGKPMMIIDTLNSCSLIVLKNSSVAIPLLLTNELVYVINLID